MCENKKSPENAKGISHHYLEVPKVGSKCFGVLSKQHWAPWMDSGTVRKNTRKCTKGPIFVGYHNAGFFFLCVNIAFFTHEYLRGPYGSRPYL